MKSGFLLLLLITFVNCYGQKVKYFDENNLELSKSKFYSKIETRKFVEIPGVSEGEKKLVLREESGKIEDVNLFYNSVQKITGRKVDFKKPIVIIYYPGPDICNSLGASDENSLKIWHKKLEKELFKIAEIKPDYIYKNSEGLKSKNILNWNKDSGIIEKAFFVHHYLCQSFVVISPDGDFLSYFGEFPTEYLLEATKLMSK